MVLADLTITLFYYKIASCKVLYSSSPFFRNLAAFLRKGLKPVSKRIFFYNSLHLKFCMIYQISSFTSYLTNTALLTFHFWFQFFNCGIKGRFQNKILGGGETICFLQFRDIAFRRALLSFANNKMKFELFFNRCLKFFITFRNDMLFCHEIGSHLFKIMMFSIRIICSILSLSSILSYFRKLIFEDLFFRKVILIIHFSQYSSCKCTLFIENQK